VTDVSVFGPRPDPANSSSARRRIISSRVRIGRYCRRCVHSIFSAFDSCSCRTQPGESATRGFADQLSMISTRFPSGSRTKRIRVPLSVV
jgi:hypothetical protein